MRKCSLNVALAFAIVLSFSASSSAQTKQPSNPATPASVDPAHDLSGVWFDDRPRPVTVSARYWTYKFNAEEPPMTAWGLAQYNATKSSFGTRAYPLAETNDPLYHTCAPPGFPRVFLHPFPIQIVQTPGEVIMLFEYDSMRHQIFTDGRAHDTTLGPLWMGDSIGHWEGDTLVADTVNFNDKTWLDRIGHPHSDAASRHRAHPARGPRSSRGRHHHRGPEGVYEAMVDSHRIWAKAEMDSGGAVL